MMTYPQEGRPTNANLSPQLRKHERDEIADQVAEFEAKGGKIQKCPKMKFSEAHIKSVTKGGFTNSKL